MKSLEISLLGSTRVVLDHQPIPGLEANKPGALLAYLVLEAGRVHARQTLAELFWPDRSDREALDSLRFALSNLRSALKDRRTEQPFLLVDWHEVRINPHATIWVDVISFQQQAAIYAAQAKRGQQPPVETLQAALNLYRGSFLERFSLSEDTNFDNWATARREQIDRHRLHLMQMLAAGCQASGNPAQAEEVYRNILAVQPWDEVTHRKLIRLLADTGQRGAALNQYEACRQALLNVLGVEPESETNTLHFAIQTLGSAQADHDPLSEQPGQAQVEGQAGGLFVEREPELNKLNTALKRTAAGQGQVVLVTGEAGSGKTALLSEFCRRALAGWDSLLVVGGRCNSFAASGQPYLPFVESVQMLAGEWETLPWTRYLRPEHHQRLQAALPRVAQALVETAPVLLDRFVGRAELARRIPERPGGPKPAWEKLLRKAGFPKEKPQAPLDTGLLFEQITRLLASLAQRSPLILLLDDLQWIDAGSAALLFHLSRRLSGSPVLILAAYRPADGNFRSESGEYPLPELINELRRSVACHQVDLDQADERSFVSSFLQKDPLLQPNRLDEGFRTALARRTGGNPLFTNELLRGLQLSGDLLCDQDGVWFSAPALNWQHLPERVEATIAGGMARLPEKWLDWLSTASVEGDTFTAEVLARVHHVDEQALLSDLSGSLNAGRGPYRLLLSEGTQWLGKQRLSFYRFRNVLFQTYLFERLDPAERARRHAAVGLALEELCASQPDEISRRAAELARHFEAGGLPERAAFYFLEGGKRAVYLGSVQSAIAMYNHGLDLLGELPPTLERGRLKINFYLALSMSFLSESGWCGPERHASIQKAIALLKEAGPEARWADLFSALYAQADWLIGQYELDESLLLGGQMLALADGSDSWSLALAHRTLGLSYFFDGKYNPARYHLEKTIEACAACGQPDMVLRIGSDLDAGCRAFLAFTLTIQGYPDQAQAQMLEALKRARAIIQNRVGLGQVLITAAGAAYIQKNYPFMQALTDELVQLGGSEEIPLFLAYGQAFSGFLQVCQAEPESEKAAAGIELLRRGKQMWEATGQRSGFGQLLCLLAEGCLKAGNAPAGLEVIAQALEPGPARGIGAGLSMLYRLQGELFLIQAQADQAAAQVSFEKALETARLQETHLLELQAAVSLARLWQAERPAEARRLLADVLVWFSEGRQNPDWLGAQALLKTLPPQ